MLVEISVVPGAPLSRSNLPSHRRVKIIGANEGLPSGHCTFISSGQNVRPVVTPRVPQMCELILEKVGLENRTVLSVDSGLAPVSALSH